MSGGLKERQDQQRFEEIKYARAAVIPPFDSARPTVIRIVQQVGVECEYGGASVNETGKLILPEEGEKAPVTN